MRKFYFILTAAAIALSATASPSFIAKKKHGKKVQSTSIKAPVAKKGERIQVKSDGIWRASKQVQSEWDEETQAWVPAMEYNDTYFDNGLLKQTLSKSLSEEEEGTMSRDTYEYDADGYQTCNITEASNSGPDNFVNYRKRTRAYDPVVKSLIVSNLEYVWGPYVSQGEEWVPYGNNYRRTVTRNDDGNVTEVLVETLYEEEYEAVQKMTVEYGADKKANRILLEVKSYNDAGELVWEPQTEYRDIVWERTDGQIVSEELTYDNNRIKSCVAYDEDGENKVNVTYGENGSFESLLTYEQGTVRISVEVLDEYGSNVYTETQTYEEDGVTYMYKMVERNMFNLDGLQTEAYMAAGEGEDVSEIPDDALEINAWMKGEAEYDPENGHTSVYTQTNLIDPEEMTWENLLKVEFSDYNNYAGLTDILTDDAGEAVYYNLQGIRIGNPEPGMILIRRQGNKARKIIF